MQPMSMPTVGQSNDLADLLGGPMSQPMQNPMNSMASTNMTPMTSMSMTNPGTALPNLVAPAAGNQSFN